MTLLLIFRLLLRRTGAAIIAVSLLALVIFYPESGSIPAYIIRFSLMLAIGWTVLFRAGLLCLTTMAIVSSLLSQIPLTLHSSSWYFGAMLLSLALIVALALYGFWTSQAGRPFFRDRIFEPAARP